MAKDPVQVEDETKAATAPGTKPATVRAKKVARASGEKAAKVPATKAAGKAPATKVAGKAAAEKPAVKPEPAAKPEPAESPRLASAITGTRAAAEATGKLRTVRTRRHVVWLRALLLAVGIVAIGAVVLMLAAYRFGRTAAPEEEAAAEGPAAGAIGERILAGYGFDYTQTSEGVPVFRIRAAESRQDRDGTSYLTTVTLDLYHENGETYTVKSDHARVKEGTWDARLEGHVVLSGWGRLELRARALELRRGGEVLVSSGAVEFSYPPQLVGRASQLQVDRRSDVVALSGGVHLHTVPGAPEPMRLDCQRLVFHRSSGILRAVGETSLKSDRQSLAAHYLTVFLAPDGRTLEAVRARWNVVGKGTVTDALGATTEIEYRGQFLDVQPDPSDPAARRVKLDGEGEAVTLKVTDESGLARIFTGFYLVGFTRDDRLEQVEGVGDPLVLLEALDLEQPFPLRQLCAEHVTARFLPAGGVSRLQLEERVEMNDTEVSLSGGRRASLNMEDGKFRIQGPEVLLSSRRGEVTAREFTWTTGSGLIRASSGVRAVLSGRSLAALDSTPLGRGSGPVHVESEEAYWTSEPPTFSFEGQVRAWRGESLLMAGQLRGDEQDRKLAASGGIRTVWAPNGAAATREPIEVSAARVTYFEQESQLRYDGSVEVRRGQSTINCQELAVELTAGGRAERMICTDAIRMRDAGTGRRVEGGDRAVYNLVEELLEIFGDEVEIHDGQNSRMRGRYVRYDLANGTFNIRSRAVPDDASGDGSP